jgi:hypothetical protein
VASLLVHVARERLPELSAGTRWDIRSDDFPHPQLQFLGDDDSLFVITREGARAILFAALDAPRIAGGTFGGGNALVCARDITDLLPRLGCPGVAELPQWARIPCVLPQDDVDFLRYTLGLAVASVGEPPQIPSDLEPYLARIERRGEAIVACTVDDSRTLPRALLDHLAWADVEDISTANIDLLASPRLRAQRCGVTGAALARMACCPRPLPFVTVAGPPLRPGPRPWTHNGVGFDDLDDWRYVERIGALMRVRRLALDARRMPSLDRILQGDLARMLQHLDLFIDPAGFDVEAARLALARGKLQRITLRCAVDPDTGAFLRSLAPHARVVVVALARNADHVTVQIEEPVSRTAARNVAWFVQAACGQLVRAVVEQVGTLQPARDHAALLEALRARLGVILQSGESLAP